MYQDLWIKGKLVKKGQRSCAGRYEAIRDYLLRTRFQGRERTQDHAQDRDLSPNRGLDRDGSLSRKRPLEVLDLGANAGYFSFRLAEDFDANVTMIESSPQIKEYHRLNANRNVSLIHKRVDVKYLQQLARSRRYDVVLALSVVHHFRDYPQLIDVLFKLGGCLFIEPPSIEEKKNSPSASGLIVGIYRYLLPHAPYILTYTPKTDIPSEGRVPLRPLFVFDHDAKTNGSG